MVVDWGPVGLLLGEGARVAKRQRRGMRCLDRPTRQWERSLGEMKKATMAGWVPGWLQGALEGEGEDEAGESPLPKPSGVTGL